MIDKTIKNTKKILYKTLDGIFTAKISEKNTLQGFRGDTYSKNSKYKNIFLSFLYIKELDIKMSLISAKGYKNAGVSYLIIKKSGELWVGIKDVGDGLGVKNISDLVLKETDGAYGKKKLTKEEIRCYKMTEREIFKKFVKISEDRLNTKSNKKVFVEKKYHDTYY